MYYAFSSALITWHNKILQAWPVGDTASHQMREKPHWWEAKPLLPPPPHLMFAINPKAPLLDNYFTGMLFDLYSERLIEILRDAGIRFETFPATVIDNRTLETMPVKYQVFHLLQSCSRQTIRTMPDPEKRLPMWRDAKWMDMVFIHENLKAVLDKEKITGCRYDPKSYI